MWYFGCTHYPLIKEEIKEVLGENIAFFDGAPSLAKHLNEVLKERKLLKEKNEYECTNHYNKESICEKVIFIDSNNSEIKKERFYEYTKKFHV